MSVLNLDRLKPDPQLNALKIAVPRPFDNTAWPDAGGFPNHAMYHLALGDNLEAPGSRMRARAPIAMAASSPSRCWRMAASSPWTPQDVVTAFDAKSGSRLWRFDPQPKDADATTYGGGVAAAGNRVYIGTGYGQVMALDAATGKVIWREG